MEETKVKAIVIGGIDYKEKDKLVNLFTLEQGIQTVVFKGVKSANAKLKSAKELFSFGDFIYTGGNNKVVTSADIIQSFYGLTKNLKKYYTGCAILDIIKTVLPEGEQNPQLFVITLKCLGLLLQDEVDNYMVLNKFLISIFKGVGYSFDVNFCNNCGEKLRERRFINLMHGDVTCSLCRAGSFIQLSMPVASALRLISNTDEDKLTTLKIQRETLISTFNILSANFEYRFNKKILNV